MLRDMTAEPSPPADADPGKNPVAIRDMLPAADRRVRLERADLRDALRLGR